MVPLSEDSIKVFLRIRPPTVQELASLDKINMSVEDTEVVIKNESNVSRRFSFDCVLGPEADQECVFRRIGQRAIDDLLTGYNSTIFAYGQTGSGKTHSILGDLLSDELKGVVPRCSEFLFYRLHEKSIKFSAKATFIEIYNEKILDLLRDNDMSSLKDKQPSLREDFRKGVWLDGANEEIVESIDDINQIILKGFKMRSVAETSMNRTSSRSHAIFTLNIEWVDESCETNGVHSKKKAALNFVDLAGSERTKSTNTSDDRLREGCAINRSLTVLGSVIASLCEKERARDKSKYIRYRDSKLTYFLKNSLGGNAKTSLLATISPSQTSYQESLSTLLFAQRAKRVKNQARINESLAGDSLKSLILELEKTRLDLTIMTEKHKILENSLRTGAVTFGAKSCDDCCKSSIRNLKCKLRQRTAQLQDLLELIVNKDEAVRKTHGLTEYHTPIKLKEESTNIPSIYKNTFRNMNCISEPRLGNSPLLKDRSVDRSVLKFDISNLKKIDIAESVNSDQLKKLHRSVENILMLLKAEMFDLVDKQVSGDVKDVDLNALLTRMTYLKNENRDLSATIEHLHSKMESRSNNGRSGEEIREEISEESENMKALRQEVGVAKERIVNLRSWNEEVLAEKDLLSKLAEELRYEKFAIIKKFEEERERYETRMSELTKSWELAETAKEVESSRILQMEDYIKIHKSKLISIKSKNKAILKQKSTLEEIISERDFQIDSLRKQEAVFRTALQIPLEENLKENCNIVYNGVSGGEIDELKHKLREMTYQNLELTQEKNVLMSKLNRVSNSRVDLLNKIKVVTDQNSYLSKSLLTIRDSLSNEGASLFDKIIHLSTVEIQKQRLEQKLLESENELKFLRESMDRLMKEQSTEIQQLKKRVLGAEASGLQVIDGLRVKRQEVTCLRKSLLMAVDKENGATQNNQKSEIKNVKSKWIDENKNQFSNLKTPKSEKENVFFDNSDLAEASLCKKIKF